MLRLPARPAALASLLVVAAMAAGCAGPAGVAPAAGPNQLTPAELSEGWILLFDGESLYGWEPSSPANWKAADGVISVSEGEKGLLNTTSEFADYVFKCDFKAPAATNSGIFLRTPVKPTDPAKDCYELNIAAPEVSPFSNGGFVQRQKATKYVEATSQWRSYEVTLEGAHAVVKIDGETVLDWTDPAPLKRGRI